MPVLEQAVDQGLGTSQKLRPEPFVQRWALRAAIVLLLGAAGTSRLQAQPSPMANAFNPAVLNSYESAFYTSVGEIKPALRAVLNAEQRRRLDEVEIVFEREDAFAFGATAFIDRRGKRIIRFSAGFIVGLLQADFAYGAATLAALRGIDPGARQRVPSFAGAMARAVFDPSARSQGSFRSYPSFWKHFGWSDERMRNLMSDPEWERIVGGTVTSSFGFILAHEIAHHLHDHPRLSGPVYDEEVQADITAAALATAIGLDPSSTFGSFAFIDGVTEHIGQSSHPAALCRVSYVAAVAAKARVGNAAAMSRLTPAQRREIRDHHETTRSNLRQQIQNGCPRQFGSILG